MHVENDMCHFFFTQLSSRKKEAANKIAIARSKGLN